MRKSRLICSKQKTKLPIEHFILLQEQRPGQLLLVNLPLLFCLRQRQRALTIQFTFEAIALALCRLHLLSLYHLFGAIILFFLFSESHAAHQLNELLAIMKCLHADISRKSSGALSGPLMSTYVWGRLVNNIPFAPLRFIRKDKKFRIDYPVTNRIYCFVIVFRCQVAMKFLQERI